MSDIKRIVKIPIDDSTTSLSLPIGRQGENNALRIIFDCSYWEDLYPNGGASLLVIRAEDGEDYLANIIQEGSNIIWDISEADTGYAGLSTCQLRWYVDDVKVKWRIFNVIIDESLCPTSAPTEVTQHWIDTLSEVASNIQVTINKFNDDVEELEIHFNNNAIEKTDEFNNNVEVKINEFDTYYDDKISEFDSHVREKIILIDEDIETTLEDVIQDINENAQEKKNEFNSNVNTKIEEFNDNVDSKTSSFDSHVSSKIESFDNNASTKNNEFNENVQNKIDGFNTNVITKTTEFNNNANQKIATMNSVKDEVYDIKQDIDDIKSDIEEDKRIVNNVKNETLDIQSNIEGIKDEVKEIAESIEYDSGEIKQQLNNKVDKVDGKGLSTNDYDDDAKSKVDAIPQDPKYTDTVYDDSEIRELLEKKTEKTRIDFNGTQFTLNGEVLNYKQLHDIHLEKPDFAFVVYGDRAYLLSYVQDDATAMREMRWESSIATTTAVKTSGIYVTSTDGINITNVSVRDINSENQGNKVSQINNNNKDNVNNYPSNKAVVDYIAPMQDDIDDVKFDVNFLNDTYDGLNSATQQNTFKIQGLESNFDTLAADVATTKEGLLTQQNTKVGYSEVVNGQLLMYSDDTKERLLATLDLPTSDLTDYVKNTDYATQSKAGLVKGGGYGINISSDAYPYCAILPDAQYKNANGYYGIGKGTLEYIKEGLVKRALTSDILTYTEAEKKASCERIGAVKDNKLELIETITLDGTETEIKRYYKLKSCVMSFENVLPSDSSANRLLRVNLFSTISNLTLLGGIYLDSWRTSGYTLLKTYILDGMWHSIRQTTSAIGNYNANYSASPINQNIKLESEHPYISYQTIVFSVPPLAGGVIKIFGIQTD